MSRRDVGEHPGPVVQVEPVLRERPQGRVREGEIEVTVVVHVCGLHRERRVPVSVQTAWRRIPEDSVSVVEVQAVRQAPVRRREIEVAVAVHVTEHHPERAAVVGKERGRRGIHEAPRPIVQEQELGLHARSSAREHEVVVTIRIHVSHGNGVDRLLRIGGPDDSEPTSAIVAQQSVWATGRLNEVEIAIAVRIRERSRERRLQALRGWRKAARFRRSATTRLD